MTAISQGLNFESRDSLPALEPSDPGPMYIRKFRVLPFCSASAKSMFSIVVANGDILNSYFHSPDLCRGIDNSGCLRESSAATCSSDSREGRILDADSSSTAQLGVSEREESFSLAVSVREHRCAFRVFLTRRLLRDRGVMHPRSSLASSQPFVKHALGCLDQTLVCFKE